MVLDPRGMLYFDMLDTIARKHKTVLTTNLEKQDERVVSFDIDGIGGVLWFLAFFLF